VAHSVWVTAQRSAKKMSRRFEEHREMEKHEGAPRVEHNHDAVYRDLGVGTVVGTKSQQQRVTALHCRPPIHTNLGLGK
jgi:hypothetical protein